MNKLMLIATLAIAACGDSGSNNSTPADAPPQQTQVDAAAGLPCFSGTPTSNDQLMNACVDQSVTVIHKVPVLPLLNPDGTLPALP